MSETQTERLLARLRRGPVTPLDAMIELGIMRLAARIADLKAAGHEIRTETVEVATRLGGTARVAQYSVAPCTTHQLKPIESDAWGCRQCTVCGHVDVPPPETTTGALFAHAQ